MGLYKTYAASMTLWWREGAEVHAELKRAWKFSLLQGYVVSTNEDDEDCIDEQLWAIREGLA